MIDWTRRHRRGLLLTGIITVGSMLAWWALANGQVSAQTATTFSLESIGQQIGLGEADLRQVAINIIRWLLGFVTLIAVAYLIYGGVLWMTAAGNEQRIEKAKQVILQALIGLVIIILAWAIVLFVARTVANTTSNGNTNGGGPGGDCIGPGCPIATTFDITAVTTCAERPEYDENVPRSSNVSLTFNHDVLPASVQKAVTDGSTSPNLVIEKCEDEDGNPDTPPDCSLRTTAVKPLQNQQYSGSAPQGAAGTPKAEWVAYDNTVTFYHLSFSNDETQPDNMYFDANTTYRVTIPAKSSVARSNSLRDTTDSGRVLQTCQKDRSGAPIEGGGCDNTPADAITWTMTTGSDTAGADLNVVGTEPTSDYLAGIGTPFRDVDRENYVFGVDFSHAIDWNSSVTPDNNFQLFKCATSPDPVTGLGCVPAASPLPGSDFILKRNPSGTGALMQPKPGVRLEPFTWYQAVAKNFRSLCGTEQQPNPFTWVFQTNDNVAGIKLVYPTSPPNVCLNSEVFVLFSTSMYKIGSGSSTCQPGTSGSYVKSATDSPASTLTPNPGRVIGVEDDYNPAAPNANCRKYAWVLTTTLLAPGQAYTATIETDLQIDNAGNMLRRSWSFNTGTANNCVQKPYITEVLPSQGKSGQCVSVIGNYFEKQPPGQPQETDGQGADKLFLGNVDQGSALSWKKNIIVSRVVPGALSNGPHPYTVEVDYGGAIGKLKSNDTVLFDYQGAGGAPGVCLVGINPDQGPPGTNTTLTGEGFGAFGGSSGVVYSAGSDWIVSPGGWSDTNISPAQVPNPYPHPVTGQVRVRTSGSQLSNPVKFDVTSPVTNPPGSNVPQVVEDTTCDLNASPAVIPSPNPKRNDTQACINTEVSGRFTIDMNTVTINSGSVLLHECNPACTTLVSPVSVSAPTNRSFKLVPPTLKPATRYQVTLTTAIVSAGSPAVPLASPYSWRFTTKSGNADCPIAAVTTTTAVATGNAIVANPNRYVFRPPLPYAVSAGAQTVDAECRTLNNTGIQFAWTTSNNSVALLTSASGSSTVAYNPVSPMNGSSQVTVAAEGKQASFEVVYDELACNTGADCNTNALGEACGPPGTSQCVNNQCTMVINAIEAGQCGAAPAAAGPVGTWPTVKGCWFGGYDSTKSKVVFNNGQDGLVPNTAICGTAAGTWTNERIVREVPPSAVTGAIQVQRADGQTLTGPVFTVNSGPLTPGLCKLNPNNGLPTTGVAASGARFGPDEPAKRPANDQVNITHLGSGTLNVMSNYVSWADDKIGTVIPAAASLGSSEARVMNENCSSNPWPFTVGADGGGGCAAWCATDADCAVAGQGCGSDSCCGPRPVIVSLSPPNNATNVCRNVQTGATFDQSIYIQPGAVSYTDNGNPVSGQAFVQGATLSYQPGLLTANAPQVESLNADAIRSLQGVRANVTGTPWSFTTGADICKIDQVRVRTGPGFTTNSFRFTSVGQQMDYRAQAWSSRGGGMVIAPIPNSYVWSWAWGIGNPAIASQSPISGAGDNPNDTKAAALTNGRTYAQASATVTVDTIGSDLNRTFRGQGEVIVEVCDFPWMIGAATGYIDSTYNFQLDYCRGNNSGNLLPNFGYTISSTGSDPRPLKSLFFKETKDTRDVIGLLIFDNPNLLSPFDWFSQRFPQDTGGSSTIIGGYPALRTGTTAYIGVTDLGGGALRGRMFVIDFNSNNASPATQNIYNQILNKIIFNTNVADLTEKQKIVNDTKRVQDLASIRLRLEAYKQANGGYPKLASGSFIIGLSTSAWPSWQQTLGNALGRALPIDPLNNFAPVSKCTNQPSLSCSQDSDCPSGGQCRACVNPFEPNSCWSEPQQKFVCPSNSHIYIYKSNGTTFNLYGRMEYTGTGSFISCSPAASCTYDPCGSGHDCRCLNYNINS